MRALIVDDSKPVRSIVARALRGLRFDCQEAANGEEALAALASGGRPDVVTVNWHMPVMDGLELVRRLRTDGPHRDLPLLMISTEHARDRVAEALATGVDAYLAKPFTTAALLRKLVELKVCTEADVVAARRPIRVLICDDSVTIRGILATVLDAEPDVEVCGTAVNGRTCLESLARDLPDIVLLDVEMPVMNGLEALREIRRLHPKLPVLMFSSLTERGAKATVDALLAGANDYVAKPAGLDPGEVRERIRTDVVGKIRAIAVPGTAAVASADAPSRVVARPRQSTRREPVRAVVIAVSTGGPNALAEVLSACATGAPVPILVVQHMPAFFTTQLAGSLSRMCGVRVVEATEGMPLDPGAVVLAPGGRHLEVAGDASSPRARLTDAPPENSCRPAADVLFRSAARVWGGGTLGVVLTGMGRDGLAGSRVLVDAGAAVLAQDEFTSVVWGMPGEVVRAGLADAVLPLGQIGTEIALRMTRRVG